MFSENEFRAALAKEGITQKELANRIGMSEATMVRRVKTGIFLTDEVFKIVKELGIADPAAVFFAGR